MKKALIAMSGGVDSGAAAYLMSSRGYDCIGATMKLFMKADDGSIELSDDHACCTSDDIEDARKVAEALHMPHYVFDFSEQFREKVMEPFVCAYEQGTTPNPCITCNRYLKFETLFQKGQELGCDYVVTGHYVRTGYDETTGRYLLKKGMDLSKDQSYVLYSLTQEQLAHVIFPLGEYTKTEIREMAEEQHLVNAHKAESQDICFVPEGKYTDFIENYRGKSYPTGSFVDLQGNKLGTHQGIIRYTIGQRKGLGIAFGKPVFVVSINPENNTVVLGDNADLFSDTLEADHLNLISTDRIREPMRVTAKVRYRHKEAPAMVEQIGDDRIRVTFDEPQRAITAGQAVVLYDGDLVVGGATIVAVGEKTGGIEYVTR